ncbi:MAG: hypothetical protein JNK11_10585 [Alphaproteobacteria bacterium]|nr:hypothetical protein [Alphaproteobacteria bacterium]
MPADTVVFGEIGLSGEVRAVGQMEARVKEAQKLGFAAALMPARRREAKAGKAAPSADGFRLEEIAHLVELVGRFGIPD